MLNCRKPSTFLIQPVGGDPLSLAVGRPALFSLELGGHGRGVRVLLGVDLMFKEEPSLAAPKQRAGPRRTPGFAVAWQRFVLETGAFAPGVLRSLRLGSRGSGTPIKASQSCGKTLRRIVLGTFTRWVPISSAQHVLEGATVKKSILSVLMALGFAMFATATATATAIPTPPNNPCTAQRWKFNQSSSLRWLAQFVFLL